MAQNLGVRASIDNFVTRQLKNDLARKSHFDMRLHPPAKVIEGWSAHKVYDDISAMADTIMFPDTASEPLQSTVGTEFEYSMINNLNYSNVNITFMCDENMTQRKFFEDWMQFIFVHKTGKGQPRYYKEYIGTIDLFQLKHGYNPLGLEKVKNNAQANLNEWTYKVTLHDVYPTVITNMEASWGSTNEFHKFNVDFHFRYSDSEQFINKSF